MQMPRQAALKKAQESRDIAALKFALQQAGDWGITYVIESYENYWGLCCNVDMCV